MGMMHNFCFGTTKICFIFIISFLNGFINTGQDQYMAEEILPALPFSDGFFSGRLRPVQMQAIPAGVASQSAKSFLTLNRPLSVCGCFAKQSFKRPSTSLPNTQD